MHPDRKYNVPKSDKSSSRENNHRLHPDIVGIDHIAENYCHNYEDHLLPICLFFGLDVEYLKEANSYHERGTWSRSQRWGRQ